MQQTLLALVAILIFSLFALSQHEVRADAEITALSAEVEMAGARLARERLADVLSRRFDEVDESGRARTTPLGLSAVLGPDTGETNEWDFDDVDDFHGHPARIVTADWMEGQVAFTDSVSVRYFSYGPGGDFVEVAGPSLMKQVTVFVRAEPDGFIGTPPIAATLRQIVTPTS
ncbi:hypothetical protein [Rubrivirga sp.]|uniref:hypothetical protein n=1 Tax=Rubrivirga sp. TaxID=1885344 RepID=UPI003C72C710